MNPLVRIFSLSTCVHCQALKDMLVQHAITCEYRQADILEYGRSCCGLHVSRTWNDGTIPRVPVPERRPPEKC